MYPLFYQVVRRRRRRARVLLRQHPDTRRGRGALRGSRFFLLFFLFPLRGVRPIHCRHACSAGTTRRGASPVECRTVRSGHSAAAPGQRDNRAALPEVESSGAVARCASRSPQGPGTAERRWKGQVEDLRMYSAHQDAVGNRWRSNRIREHFPGFSTLSILQEIQKDLEEKNIQPENFEDRIIFMSMTFCGKQMMRIASRTLRKSRTTRRNSFQDIGPFLVAGRKRDGTATLTLHKDSGIAQPTKWYSNSKKLVILSSQVPVL